MPSWFIHFNVAKKAINDLPSNPRVASILGNGGPTANTIVNLAKDNPSYFALGSIGPDLFVFLPDFKPPMGPTIYKIMKFMEGFYEEIDPFITAYEDSLGPQIDAAGSIANALSGGLLDTVIDTGTQFLNVLQTALEDFVVSQYDWFSLLGSGLSAGYDEQTYYWSDMLHYRKTYEFGARLWKNANTDQEKAYALGWMTHMGTDVTGHSFVNQKCGGMYRLHWQRHHLIENFMDAYVYDQEFGSLTMYQSLCGSAEHLWIAFDDDGTPLPPSHKTNSGITTSIFNPQDRPIFDPNDKQAMRDAWDVDSDLPQGIKDLLINTMKDVYPDGPHEPADPYLAGSKEQCSDHPAILTGGYPKQNDLDSITIGNSFYTIEVPNHGDIETAYFYLFKYVKMSTTGFYDMQPPNEPPVIPWPDFPTPPGDAGWDGSLDSAEDIWDFVLAIASCIQYVANCLLYLPACLAALVAGPVTYPLRQFVYEFVELPLYNIWKTFHWVLSITGYTIPLPGELTPALYTLGVGFSDNWTVLEAQLNDLTGGLIGTQPVVQSEPSGVNMDKLYPRDVVSDPARALPNLAGAIGSLLDDGEVFSEFTRPWRYPSRDNQGHNIRGEKPELYGASSPYHAGQNANDLMHDEPGDNQFRKDLENAMTADETINLVMTRGSRSLGDPSDYSAYVISKLTRDMLPSIANFNLDSDRGYGFLCWDWLRSKVNWAAPQAYKDNLMPNNSKHKYKAPCNAGTGWDDKDILDDSIPHPPQHNPYENNPPVKIRYIDREEKEI